MVRTAIASILFMTVTAGGQSPPATQPATRPAGFAIRGSVTVEQGWSLQKPDLTRVVIYLGSDPTLDAQSPARPAAEVSQYHKAFDPDLLVVPRGTLVEFPNWDHFYHNVFSRSKIAPPFDLERYQNGRSKNRTFDTVGVVHVLCNIHPQMHGIIVVTPNTYFTRADAQGHFELHDVPAGEYQLVTWFERSGEERQPLHIGGGQAADIAVALSENRNSILANVPPSREPGYGVERGLGIKRERLDLPVVKDVHPAPQPPHQ